MDIRFSEDNETDLGHIKIGDLLVGNEIIYLKPNCPSKKVKDVLLHEEAHIRQLKKFSKRTLIFFQEHFWKIDFHDDSFYKIYNKLLEGEK